MKLRLHHMVPLVTLLALALPATASASASPRPSVSVRAGIPLMRSTGGGETIRATLHASDVTCIWTSSPRIKGFDARTRCAHKMARVARFSANQYTHLRRFVITLSVIDPHVVVRGRAVVQQAPTLPPTLTPTPSSTGSSSDTSAFTMSSNWSGYVLPSTTLITEVSATWTVPTLKCPASGGTDASSWVGIGGVDANQISSGDLLQTGIDNRCESGSQQEYGWFELYPSHPNYAEAFDNFPVNPGDVIHGEVVQDSTGQWSTILEDLSTNLEGVFTVGRGWQVESTTTQTPVGALQGDATGTSYAGGYTAEWIVEDPTDANTGQYSTFANYGTQTFSNLTTSLASWSLAPSDGNELVQNGVTLSVPSSVSNNVFSCSYTGP